MKLIQSEDELYIQETEIKPNRYAALVLSVCTAIVLFCCILTEIGIFRVGKTEMRIGTAITLTSSLIPLLFLIFRPESRRNPGSKYIIMLAVTLYTASVGTFLFFHTTIMLIFPIFFAMLYRSKPLGVFATVSSLACTLFTPIIGYLLGTWDVPLLQELILIATNGNAVIEGAYPGLSLLNVGKILLYIVFPRLLMVGSSSILLFYVIRISVAHVENQILLHHLSKRDALTGLYNQNSYKEMLARAAADKEHENDPAAVLFFDINDLKKVNDTSGHELGDLLIRRSADSFLPFCDDETFVCFRVGGDEFAAILPGADEKKATRILSEWKKVTARINDENMSDPRLSGTPVSLAAGIAAGRFKDLPELLKQADARMYLDKKKYKE